MKAGNKTEKGYDSGTVFDKVEKKIQELYSKSRAIKSKNIGEEKNDISKISKKTIIKKSGNKNPRKKIK